MKLQKITEKFRVIVFFLCCYFCHVFSYTNADIISTSVTLLLNTMTK